MFDVKYTLLTKEGCILSITGVYMPSRDCYQFKGSIYGKPYGLEVTSTLIRMVSINYIKTYLQMTTGVELI